MESLPCRQITQERKENLLLLRAGQKYPRIFFFILTKRKLNLVLYQDRFYTKAELIKP